jgi:hypothetical protein
MEKGKDFVTFNLVCASKDKEVYLFGKNKEDRFEIPYTYNVNIVDFFFLPYWL